MSDENKDNQDAGTEGQDDVVQTVTIEQFEELKARNEESLKLLEDLKKSQSGSDSKVSELQKLLKQKEEEGKTEEQKFAERIETIEKERDGEKAEKQKALLKGHAMEMLADKGIKVPKYLNRLIGEDIEETEENINEYIEEQLEMELAAADRFAKGSGRKVQKGKSDLRGLDDYSDDELKAMSDKEFFKIQERSKKT